MNNLFLIKSNFFFYYIKQKKKINVLIISSTIKGPITNAGGKKAIKIN